MKIRIFPSPRDTYNSIIIETDKLPVAHNDFNPESLPFVYVSELIEDLINLN